MQQDNKLTKLGSTKTEYKDQYDPSQIELIERAPRRITYTAPMNGYDIWTCFEVSGLLKSGLPFYCVLRILNPANSKYIFESKSLKLYLNSFNNSIFESKEEALKIIQTDLSRFTESNVIVREVTDFSQPILDNHYCLEDMIENKNIKIDQYNYSKELLSITSNCIEGKSNLKLELGNISLYSNLLRSNCELTNQPDWARITINFTPDKSLLDYRALLKYIISYRNHNEFHEPTCERIYNDLYEILQPKKLTVLCQYTRRGGIDINPYRSTENNVNESDFISIPKLLQQ